MNETAQQISHSAFPFVWLAAAFAVGIALAEFSGLQTLIDAYVEEELSVVYFLLPAISLILLIFFVKRYLLAALLMLLAFVSLGAFCFYFEKLGVAENRIRNIYDQGRIGSGEPVLIEGKIVGSPEPAVEGVSLTVSTSVLSYKTSAGAVSGSVRLFLPIKSTEVADDLATLRLRHGSTVRVTCYLIREDQYLNPGVTSRTAILDRQGIDAIGTIKSPLMIEPIAGPSAWDPLTIFFDLRRSAIETISEKFDRQTAGMLIAAMLGDRYFLDRETAETFRRGGTFHILVISGLHMTFIGGIILLVIRRFTQNRWAQFATASAIIWVFTLAVGAEPPAVRASLMFSTVLFGYALYRSASLVNSLGLCVLMLLVWRPSDLFNPSFQLTLVSVGAIVGMAVPLLTKLRSVGEWMPRASRPFPPNVPNWLRRFCETLYWDGRSWEIESERNVWSANLFKRPFVLRDSPAIRRFASRIFEGLAVSTIVQIWMLPLLVYYFHRMPVASIFLNLWVGALMAVMSISALAASLISQISAAIAWPLIGFVEAVGWLITRVSGLFAASGDYRIPVYSGTLRPIYLVYLVPVVALGVILYRWFPFEESRRAAQEKTWNITALSSAALILVLGLVIVFHPFGAPSADGRLRVDFLDVGQGDSALVTFPNGETMLIDGGGRVNYRSDAEDSFEPDISRIGERVVSEFLWERGLSRIDHIVASHGDADHIQGLVDVASNFRIGQAYFAAVRGETPEQIELTHVLERHGVETEFLQTGDSLEIGGVRIDVLFPGADEPELKENDRSLVLLFTFGERRILFTGDIETKAEQRLLASGQPGPVDVVKVAHHGSRTSSTPEFVSLSGPEFAVIPVGKRSMFGHPHAEVVDRWASSGAKILTTGEKGTISLWTDGKHLELATFLSGVPTL